MKPLFRALSTKSWPFDGIKTAQSVRRGAQRDLVDRASDATQPMGCFAPPKAAFSRSLDFVMSHLWSIRPLRETCLASKREKTVKRPRFGRKCSHPLLASIALAGFVMFSISTATSAKAQSTEYIIFDVKGSAEGLAEKFVLGSVLKDGDKIEIPENAEIRLLDKAGEVIVLAGPLTGTVADEDGNSQKAKDGSNALQVIAKLMFGENNLVNNLGAARALQSVQTDKGKIQPWVPVISKPGTYCLPMSEPIFGRAVALKKAKVTVISGSEIFKEKIWNENEKSISIAEMVDKKTDRYTMFLSSHTAESSIHLLDRSNMNTTEQIAWMAERGCKAQAVQLLNEVSAAANKEG